MRTLNVSPIRALLFAAVFVPSVTAAAPETFDEEVVRGEVLAPEITVIISRENLNKAYDLKLDEDFLQRIVDSVKVAPF